MTKKIIKLDINASIISSRKKINEAKRQITKLLKSKDRFAVYHLTEEVWGK